ncbi:alpha/beta hydrolase family protein [Brevibacterium spongiae]|uniref:Alpha/beta hydrolase n=1 Tax=Brevibacterium spongiae TaxID=2909672 RepID=A0ABY5SLQ7_9MICO|nr:alpha/beta hydrolase [Brevibacterium spongiae]UVI35472.1 alpha/beta hydrolase [Brevibacterium spongiae]
MSGESVRIPELSAAGAAFGGPTASFGGLGPDDGGPGADTPAFRHAYGEAPEQFVEVYGDPAAASTTVIFVHGGYFRPRTDLAHARPLALSLAASGVLVVLVEYRRDGGQPLLLDDVTAAIEAVQFELPNWDVSESGRENLIVSGHSAGGCLVLAWASHLPEDGPRFRLRPLAPVTDLLREVAGSLGDGAVLDYMGVRPEEDLQAYLRHDPRSRAVLIPGRVDVRSIHGDADETVAIEFSRVFPAALTELPGANHADVIDPESPYFPQVRDLLLG